ncbi:monocarboxylate transporter 10-like [Porites lutea]|uniref:monocarboxylate transporter 10-like n=1 Tax=Porites lutea TaxID=51062 RepID=UPI003CC6C233
MMKLKDKCFKTEDKKKKEITVLVEREECPDGGYGWIICIAAAIIQFIILGIHNNFGILYTYFMKDLDADPADTAWIGSIAFGMNFLCGPIASSLCQRFGYRIVAAVGGLIAALGLLLTSFTNSLYLIYLTYSVLWGFGSSLNYAPTMLVLGQYFQRHLPLANGIVTAGSGIGTLAMGPFYHFLLSNLGWKIMLRILSGFAFLMFVSALLYRPLPAKYKRACTEKKERAKLFDLSVWKIKPFVFWVVSMSLLFVGYFVPFIHLPNHAKNLGVPGYESALLIGYLSIASTVSRVLFGLVLNHPRINRFYVLQLCFLMMSVTCTLCPLARDYTGLILYAVGFGIFDGCFVLLIAITTSDVVGPNRLPQALGTLYGVISLPMIFGPPLAAFIFQVSGSYQNAFFVAGGAIAIGTCTLSLIPFFMPETRENVESTEVRKEPLEKDKTIQDSNCTAERQRNSYIYDTSQFAWRRPLSCQLATGRLGDMLSVECILDMLERETDV